MSFQLQLVQGYQMSYMDMFFNQIDLTWRMQQYTVIKGTPIVCQTPQSEFVRRMVLGVGNQESVKVFVHLIFAIIFNGRECRSV